MSHRTPRATLGRAAVLSALCAVSAAMAAPPPATPCPEDAQAYWASFRAAALKGDLEAVADLTKFPLEITGQLHDSEVHHIPRQQLRRWWPELLKADPGHAHVPSTMKIFVKAHPRLLDGFCSPGGGQFNVANWTFLQEAEGWRFVTAAVDE